MIDLHKHPSDPAIAVMRTPSHWVIIAHHDVRPYRTKKAAIDFLYKAMAYMQKNQDSGRMDARDSQTMRENINVIAWQIETLEDMGDE